MSAPGRPHCAAGINEMLTSIDSLAGVMEESRIPNRIVPCVPVPPHQGYLLVAFPPAFTDPEAQPRHTVKFLPTHHTSPLPFPHSTSAHENLCQERTETHSLQSKIDWYRSMVSPEQFQIPELWKPKKLFEVWCKLIWQHALAWTDMRPFVIFIILHCKYSSLSDYRELPQAVLAVLYNIWYMQRIAVLKSRCWKTSGTK